MMNNYRPYSCCAMANTSATMKIPKNIALDQLHEEDIWSDEWEDYVYHNQQNDWTDYDDQPWAWYMECNLRTREGWQLVTINPNHKDVTVIYWLKSQDTKFKYSKYQFLIEKAEVATMTTLKFA